MSFGTGGFMGSGGVEKKTTTVSQETTTAQDQRSQIEGNVAGSFLGPEAAVVSGGGAVKTGSYSPVTQVINNSGLSGTDVKQILDRNVQASLEQQKSISDLAVAQTANLSSLAASSVNAMAAQKTGEPISLSRYTPYFVVGAVFLALVWAGGYRK